MNRFVFIAPMFNAGNTLQRMLHSIYGQSYDNWHLILIDDISNNDHKTICKKSLDAFESLAPGKTTVIWNEKKLWEVANVLQGISLCNDDDIICRIDADDWLVDLDALMIMNAAYVQTNCDVAWSAHRWAYSDRNISGPLPDNADPYQHPWVTSHLKTFRKKLINDVNDINFRGEDGEYIKRAGDQAIYLPVLKKSQKRFFVPRVLYHYTIVDEPQTYQTKDALFQKDEAVFLRKRGYVS